MTEQIVNTYKILSEVRLLRHYSAFMREDIKEVKVSLMCEIGDELSIILSQ